MDYKFLVKNVTRERAIEIDLITDVTRRYIPARPEYRAQAAVSQRVLEEINGDVFAADFEARRAIRLDTLLIAAADAMVTADLNPENIGFEIQTADFKVLLTCDDSPTLYHLVYDGGDDNETPSITILLQGELRGVPLIPAPALPEGVTGIVLKTPTQVGDLHNLLSGELGE